VAVTVIYSLPRTLKGGKIPERAQCRWPIHANMMNSTRSSNNCGSCVSRSAKSSKQEAWGECTFRASGGSMFAMTDNNHHESRHEAVWIKAPAMVQEILINSDPGKFFKPPYLGPKGRVGRTPQRRYRLGRTSYPFNRWLSTVGQN
jgi:hypothetical protein